LFIEDFEVSGNVFGSSYLVIPTNFDEVPTELESKVVDASSDTLCFHDIFLF
jgi:hypothetical protein